MKKRLKLWLILASALILAGIIIFGGVMTVFKWDFTQLTTYEYETHEYTITEAYHSISVNTKNADVEIVPVAGETKTTVNCHEQVLLSHEVHVTDGVLYIDVIDDREWHDYIGINFKQPTITVTVPQAEYDSIIITATTGDIHLDRLTVASVDISVTTGDINICDVTCSSNISCSQTTGDAVLKRVNCNTLTASGTTGDMSMTDVIAKTELSVSRRTGSIWFERCDAEQISAHTTTGNIIGSIRSGKEFITHTSTGRINVPKSTSGGTCTLSTVTGNINISIAS